MGRHSVMQVAMAACWAGSFFFVGMKYGEQNWRKPCLAIIEKSLREIAPANKTAAKKEQEHE